MVGHDGEEFDGPVMFSDPDAYKEDWVQSFVYKKAMKAEAIKRGEVIDSDWECTDDEDKVAEDSQGALSCAMAIGMMGGSCDDDSALVAMGAPAGWIGSLCLESCGYCGGDDHDGEEEGMPACLEACQVVDGIVL